MASGARARVGSGRLGSGRVGSGEPRATAARSIGVGVRVRVGVCVRGAQGDWVQLQREARKLRRLRHPYVAAVEGVVWDRDHHLVYMMSPFYAGGSLRQLIERGAVSAADARLFSKQVGTGASNVCSGWPNS